MSLQREMPCKSARQWSRQQHMIRFFHNQPGDSDRMDEAFDRGHSAGPKRGPFHNRGIHSLHPVQLAL